MRNLLKQSTIFNHYKQTKPIENKIMHYATNHSPGNKINRSDILKTKQLNIQHCVLYIFLS